MLFFGCRRSDEDFLYRDEWEEIDNKVAKWKAEGDPRAFDWQLVTAFSRETSKKVYVQHRIAEHGEKVWDILNNKKGNLYICG